MSDRIKVLVVDDSALMRKLIPQMLQRDRRIEVVGTAMDGEFALQKMAELEPDVVTLDLEMPRMDGMELLRQIIRRPRPRVIVVSAYSTQGASATFKALAMGAFDFVAKPSQPAGAHMEEIAGELVQKIRAAAQSPLSSLPAVTAEVCPRRAKESRPKVAPDRVIAIGISTGGPTSLQHVLSKLPADFPAAFVIVQHMPRGFTELFARRLDDCCAIEVKEACSGDLLLAGRALICPGGRHMKVRHMPLGDVVVLSDEDRVNGHRPSVELLFHSVAQVFGSRAVGVLMTGMGEDGADAIGEIKGAGGVTIAQSAESCVVFGMPRAAIQRGHITQVVPLEQMAGALQSACSARQEGSSALPSRRVPNSRAVDLLGD